MSVKFRKPVYLSEAS